VYTKIIEKWILSSLAVEIDCGYAVRQERRSKDDDVKKLLHAET
jgi:hypothetical protein